MTADRLGELVDAALDRLARVPAGLQDLLETRPRPAASAPSERAVAAAHGS